MACLLTLAILVLSITALPTTSIDEQTGFYNDMVTLTNDCSLSFGGTSQTFTCRDDQKPTTCNYSPGKIPITNGTVEITIDVLESSACVLTSTTGQYNEQTCGAPMGSGCTFEIELAG